MMIITISVATLQSPTRQRQRLDFSLSNASLRGSEGTEGREGRSQAGPKGNQLEVGPNGP